MDKYDLSRLQAQRLHLAAALAAIDKALEALPPVTRHSERARLNDEMQAALAELRAVDDQLSSLRTLGCCDEAVEL
jgi:hypothetical protein